MTFSKVSISALAALLLSVSLLTPALADGPRRHHPDRPDRPQLQQAPTLLEAPALSPRALKKLADPVLVDASDLQAQLGELHRALDDLSALTQHMRNRDLQASLCHQITQTSARVAHLERALQQAPRLQLAVALPQRPQAPPSPPARPQAAPAERFQSLQQTLQSTYGASDRLNVLRAISQHNHFTTAQIAALAQGFYGSSQRLDALLTLLPRATDPENLHQLYPLVYGSSDRARLIEAVQRLPL
jgi:hypothetical protein